MDQRLKERLIGAAVLVAVGVWLIPWVLDGRAPAPDEDRSVPLQLPSPDQRAPVKSETLDLGAERAGGPAAPGAKTSAADGAETRSRRKQAEPPPEPEVQVAAAEPQTRTAGEAPAEAVSEAADDEPVAATKSGASATTSAADRQWMVQLGSFGEEENAKRLADRVAGIGFDAQISTHRSGGRVLHRVRVGPEATRNEAEATASALSAHGFVARVVTAD
jgi:DedD protein